MANTPRSGEHTPDPDTIGSSGAPLSAHPDSVEPVPADATPSDALAPASDSDSPSESIEPPTASFDDFELPPPLREALRAMGWTAPTAVQSMTFDLVRQKRDVLVQSQTGSGKTGAFCLPWLATRFESGAASQTGVQLLVLTPTRELAKQVCEQLDSLAHDSHLVALPIYGGTAMHPQLQALREGVHAVVGTPGRILDHIRRRSLDLSRVRMVVLDEADEMLSMGFLEDIHAILEACPVERQTTLFSATVPPDIERIARRYMRSPESVRLSGDQVAAAEIDHTYYAVTGTMRVRDLVDIINLEEPTTGIVFCNTREETNIVASVLQREGFAAEALSSDLTQSARERVMGRMRSGKLRFLVATDVASRGIDISHVSHVINYTFPENAESYIHRTGRTGRAGRLGIAISLVAPQNLGSFYMLKKLYPSLRFEEHQLPTPAELEAQRIENKLDMVSKRFPELVSPEWTLLARNLMKDPRGERVIAYLLSEAMSRRTQQTQSLQLDEAHAPEPSEFGDRERPRRGFDRRDRGRRRDRDRDHDRDRDRGYKHDDERRTRAGDEARMPAQPQEISNDAALLKTPHESSVEDEVSTRPAAISSASEGAAEASELEVRRRRRRRRRGKRDGDSDAKPAATAGSQQPANIVAPLPELGTATEALGTGAVTQEETVEASSTPSELAIDLPVSAEAVETTDDGARTEEEPSRRRRRRRRRRRGGATTASDEAAAVESRETEASEVQADDAGDEGDASRRRRRRRRGGRRRGVRAEATPPPVQHVSQDQIIIDIDESELEIVRDEFGEIDELDDLTLKSRRRGVIDDLQDEVELEDVSEREAETANEDDEDAAASAEDGVGESDDPDGEDVTDEMRSAQAIEDTKKKRRRRRRRKKKEDVPAPELTAPPHKDFWEVWAAKFSFREFEDEVWYQSHTPPPQDETHDDDAARPSVNAASEDDSSFVSLRLNIGRKHGKKAAHIRELLDQRVGLSGRAVRNLTVGDASTRLRVSEQAFARVQQTLSGFVIDEHELIVTRIDTPAEAPGDGSSATDAPANVADVADAPSETAAAVDEADEGRPPNEGEPSETVFG